MRYIFLFLLFTLFIPGCAQKEISENEFKSIWREYIKKEFVEGFDVKQSIAQKKKILGDVLSNYDIKYKVFKEYIMKKHENKYKKIFME